MIKQYIFLIPGLIILGALFYYFIRKKDALSAVLFFSCLVSTTISVVSWSIQIRASTNFQDKIKLISLLGTVSMIAYCIYAVAFLLLIKKLVTNKQEEYNFLDDSRSD